MRVLKFIRSKDRHSTLNHPRNSNVSEWGEGKHSSEKTYLAKTCGNIGIDVVLSGKKVYTNVKLRITSFIYFTISILDLQV